MKFKTAIFTSWAILTISACDSDQATQPLTNTEAELVLTVKESGGCARMGPNCGARFLFSDGTVEAARNEGETTTAVEVTASIDRELTQNLITIIENEDFESLRQSLPVGSCQGCVDGVDFEYIINSEPEDIIFSSIQHQFDTSTNFFATAEVVYRGMKEVTPLVLRRR